ncbi:MAG: PQQ-binding-like beta-propeller repeat protein [Labilithrix sp.]|nr:PQQ-binding-like beta-propeller repeat protein [Labilithrix sp.]MCW5814308.1 PQQ-binding-like beta-propeller repeat protein [Labilithrix sp.]
MRRLFVALVLLAGCARPARPAGPAARAAVGPAPEVLIQGWPEAEIRALAFDATGTMLAAPLEDETLFFDVVTGTLTARAKKGEAGPFEPRTHWAARDTVEYVAAAGLVAGARTTRSMKKYQIPEEDFGRVHLWSDAEPRGEVRCLARALGAIALSSDGGLLACTGDGAVVVVDRATDKHTVHHPRPYETAAFVTDLVFHPTKPLLVAAGTAGLWAYEADTGAARRLEARLARSAAFNADGSLLATGNAIGEIELWDTRSWERVRTLRTRTSPILTLAADPRAPRVYVAAGGKIDAVHETVWDLRDGGAAPRAIEEAPDAVAFSPDGELRVASRFDTLVGTRGGKEVWRTQVRKVHFEHVAFVSEDTFLAYGSGHIASLPEDHALRAFDARTGTERWATPKELGFPAALAVSPDGALAAIAIGRGGGHVEVLDAQTGRRVMSIPGSEELRERASIAFVDRRLVAVTGIAEGAMLVADVTSGKVVARLEGVRGAARVAALPDGAALADATGALVLLDRAWKVRRRIDLHAGAPAGLVVAGRTLVWSGKDGSGRAVDLATGAVSTFAAATSGAIVAVAPGGEYLAPRDASGAFAFRWGDRAYPFEQFDAVYNDPATALRALGSAAPAAIDAFAAARARRLERLGLVTAAATRGGAVPTIGLPDVPPVSNAKRVTLHVVGADPARRLRRLHVFANGVPVFGERGKELAPSARIETEVEVELAPGPNKLQAAVENEDGILSLEATAVTTYIGPAPRPKVHVFAAGVSRYRDRSLDLAFPAKDARDVGAALCADGQCAPNVLVDAQATRSAIAAWRGPLARTNVEDTAIVYVSGHGVLDRRGGYLFAPHDIDARDLERTGIPYAELEGLLDGIPARHKLLVMDTCHAGELDPDEARAIAAGGKVRAAAPSGRLGLASARAKATRDLFADLRRGTGTHVLASSSGVEYSLEDATFQNSIFTHAFLTGLRDREADPDGAGPIRVSALRAYVTKAVLDLTAGHQTPTTRRENLDADFDLTPNAPRPAATPEDTCRKDRDGDGYSCGHLSLLTFGPSERSTSTEKDLLAAARRSLEASATKEKLMLEWEGARFVARDPRVAHAIEAGVVAAQPDDTGRPRLVVCRAGHALPAVLARCDRALAALAGKALPELLPP